MTRLEGIETPHPQCPDFGGIFWLFADQRGTSKWEPPICRRRVRRRPRGLASPRIAPDPGRELQRYSRFEAMPDPVFAHDRGQALPRPRIASLLRSPAARGRGDARPLGVSAARTPQCGDELFFWRGVPASQQAGTRQAPICSPGAARQCGVSRRSRCLARMRLQRTRSSRWRRRCVPRAGPRVADEFFHLRLNRLAPRGNAACRPASGCILKCDAICHPSP